MPSLPLSPLPSDHEESPRLPLVGRPLAHMLSLVFSSAAFQGPAQLAGSRSPAAQMRTAAPVIMAGGTTEVSFPTLDGSEVRIGILKARWHEGHIGNLVGGIKEALTECKVPEENIVEYEVPGAFELPLACRYLALSGKVDAIIPVGVLIKGDTTHFEVISESAAKGLMDVGLSTGIPVIFGLLTANNEEQVVARSVGSNNHGNQWGMAAVDMALLRKTALSGAKSKSFLGFGQEDSDEASTPPANRIGF